MGQSHSNNTDSDPYIDHKQIADEIMEKITHINRSIFWFGSETSKKEQLVYLYRRASDHYKIAEYKRRSAYSLQSAINLELDLKHHSKYLIGLDLINIAVDIRDTDTYGAISALEKAEQLLVSDIEPRTLHCGKCNEILASIYEENGQNPNAIGAYETAIRYYQSGTYADFDIIRCCDNLINLFLIEESYNEIIDFSEINATINKRYTNLKVNVDLLISILSIFVQDNLIQVEKILSVYKNSYEDFGKSPEYKFLIECVNLYKKCNFDTLLDNLDRMSSILDNPNAKKLINIIYAKVTMCK